MKKLAITIGDPSGVGPEIILKWARQNPQLAEKCEVIGNAQLFEVFLRLSQNLFSLSSPGEKICNNVKHFCIKTARVCNIRTVLYFSRNSNKNKEHFI